tara:strand:+ start:1662 stop:1925 length:264 start_codon:yes stop_codon:yes gene_type:complete
MQQEKEFGYSAADKLQIGDIVAWSKWSEEINDWVEHLGILVDIQNEVHSNRLVSISKVVPLDDNNIELSFFTFTLRLVSQTSKENKT